MMGKMTFAVCVALIIGLGTVNPGIGADAVREIVIISDNTWKSLDIQQSGWEMRDFDDSGWRNACAPYPNAPSSPTDWIPGTQALYMWDHADCSHANGTNGPYQSWFRKSFDIPASSMITDASVTFAADDDFDFYINGQRVFQDNNGEVWQSPDDLHKTPYNTGGVGYTINIKPYIIPGKNVFAMTAKDSFGAYEWAMVEAKIRVGISPGRILYVKKDATGSNNGISWADAYIDLRTALSFAISGDEIWVAKGVYKGYFRMKNGVKIYGGFAGGETLIIQRNWLTNKTVLSGDVGGDDTVDGDGITITVNGINLPHVVINEDLDNTSVWDGFVITGGHSKVKNGDSSNEPYYRGGGIYNVNSNPIINNCSFSGNSVECGGGGIYNDNSSPIINNCSFFNNSTIGGSGLCGGGGIFNYNSSNPTITNCSFSNNSTEVRGGGVLNFKNSNPTITNCSFSDNLANSGGGMHNYENSRSIITNCSFSNNSAYTGGGMSNLNSSPIIKNCFFSHNSASEGGGMGNFERSSPSISNSSFSDNSVEQRGGGMLNCSYSTPLINSCSFSRNLAKDGGGMWNEDSGPRIINSSFSRNSATCGGGGIFNIRGYYIPDSIDNNKIIHIPTTIINSSFSDNSAFDSSSEAMPDECFPYVDGSAILIAAPYVPIPIYNSILWNSGSEIVGWAEVKSSIIKGGWTGGGSNNKNLDPLFMNAVAGDLRLQSGSPAINAGNNSYIPVSVTADLNGNPRISDGTVDMGAYESPSVDINGDGVIDINDLNIIKANLNKSVSVCPRCDLDKDEKITVADARKLMNMCNCPKCICP